MFRRLQVATAVALSLLPAACGNGEAERIAAAEALVRAYYEQVERWKAENAVPRPPGAPEDSRELYDWLHRLGARARQAYFDSLIDNMRQFVDANPEPMDPWGNEIMWTRWGFAVISAGPDGVMWTPDDIRYPPVETGR